MVTCDLSHGRVRSSGHINWLAAHVICHTVAFDLAAHATWHTITFDLAALQPGLLTIRPSTLSHATYSIHATWRMIHIAWCRTAPVSRTSCPNQRMQDVAYSRCRCHMHTHATSSPLEPQDLIQEDTNCTSEVSYKIYYICSFPLCIIEFFISSLGTYRPKYHYEFVTTPSVNIIK